jgi:hypothetical protein
MPNLPYQDLSKTPVSLEAILQLLSGTNPIIRAPIEILTNQQWFSGRPITDYAGETQNIPLGGLLKQLGVQNVPQMDKRVLGYLFNQIPVLRNLDIMTDPENARRVSRFSSSIGGPSLYSAESVRRSKEYEELRILQDLIRKLTDEGVEIPAVKDLKTSGSRIRQILLGR